MFEKWASRVLSVAIEFVVPLKLVIEQLPIKLSSVVSMWINCDVSLTYNHTMFFLVRMRR
jgi:hypothetical protein